MRKLILSSMMIALCGCNMGCPSATNIAAKSAHSIQIAAQMFSDSMKSLERNKVKECLKLGNKTPEYRSCYFPTYDLNQKWLGTYRQIVDSAIKETYRILVILQNDLQDLDGGMDLDYVKYATQAFCELSKIIDMAIPILPEIAKVKTYLSLINVYVCKGN